jgi:hypothetical protein
MIVFWVASEEDKQALVQARRAAAWLYDHPPA